MVWIALVLGFSCGIAMPYARLHQSRPSRRLALPANVSESCDQQDSGAEELALLSEDAWIPLALVVSWTPAPERPLAFRTAPRMGSLAIRPPPAQA